MIQLPGPLKNNMAADSSLGQPNALRGVSKHLAVIASVNDSALQTWAELWEELNQAVTPAGLVPPQTQSGFKPPSGWADFLEKFWLLKHYLDFTHRFCAQSHREPVNGQ